MWRLLCAPTAATATFARTLSTHVALFATAVARWWRATTRPAVGTRRTLVVARMVVARMVVAWPAAARRVVAEQRSQSSTLNVVASTRT